MFISEHVFWGVGSQYQVKVIFEITSIVTSVVIKLDLLLTRNVPTTGTRNNPREERSPTFPILTFICVCLFVADTETKPKKRWTSTICYTLTLSLKISKFFENITFIKTTSSENPLVNLQVFA